MIYHTKASLEDLRKSNIIPTLYAIYNHLALPVIEIDHLSKKYVYWKDNSKHSYPSRSAGYVLCDNQSEAWKLYKSLFEKKLREVEEEYKINVKKLSVARNILEECSIETPEYFI